MQLYAVFVHLFIYLFFWRILFSFNSNYTYLLQMLTINRAVYKGSKVTLISQLAHDVAKKCVTASEVLQVAPFFSFYCISCGNSKNLSWDSIWASNWEFSWESS